MPGILIESTYLLLVGGVLLISFAMNYIFGGFFFTVQKQAPSILVFRNAYKKNLPVVEVIDGGGNVSHFLGEKDKKYDPDFKKKDWGVKISPTYSTVTPGERLPKGVALIRYGVSLHFATDSRGLHGLIALIRHIRYKYPIFNVFNDDMLLVEFVDMESEELNEFVVNKLKDFDPDYDEDDTDRIDEIIESIELIKKELPKLNIRSEPISLAQCLKYVDTGFSAQDYNKGMQLIEMRTNLERDKMVNVLTYAVAACIALCGLGGLIYVSTM